MERIEEFLKNLLIQNYDLGEITEITAIKQGDTNRSFLVSCRKEQNGTTWYTTWYVRQYNSAEEERDIRYEHAFEEYFHERVDGEIQTLLPIKTKSGNTWLHETFDGKWNYYAVFYTVSGREPYSWEFNDLTQTALDSCARITAKFQTWAYGFCPPKGSGRRESSLEEQFQLWREDLPKAIREKERTPKIYRRFSSYLKEEMGFLLDMIDFCEEQLMEYKKYLKLCINHKDLNPGNLMFDEDDKVCAIFDMDWVNTDYRLYDVAWMGYQSTASWDVKTWGEVPIEKVCRFIHRYNRTMEEIHSPVGPITGKELEFLPVMMIIGALKVIMDFVCYEDHTEDPDRVFVNTWRFVDSVHDMRERLEEMKEQITKHQ